MKHNTRIPIGQINKTKNWFSDEIKKIGKIKAAPRKKDNTNYKNRETRKQVYPLQPPKPTKTTSPTNIPEIFKAIKESYELFYVKRLENLFEMDNSQPYSHLLHQLRKKLR